LYSSNTDKGKRASCIPLCLVNLTSESLNFQANINPYLRREKLTTEEGNGRHGLMRRWLVISLFIPKECEDGICNFLIEQGAAGIEEVDEDSEWKRLRTYFPQDGKEERIPRSLRRYLRSLQNLYPKILHIPFEASAITEQNWAENWKRFFKPVQITSRLVVKPPWSKTQLKKDQIPINISPGMAFGTGTHATTKMCIQALEQRLRKRGLAVLDVGTGSGILLVVAAKLGAGEVWGVDIDGVAIENARENARQNGISDIVRIRKGSVGHICKRFDVVVANIDLRNLKRMRWPLIHHLKSQGFLILSGALEEERERLRQHYMDTGQFRWAKAIREGEWVCLTFRKK
jgi:ribosomal protein L11 methyltransferase